MQLNRVVIAPDSFKESMTAATAAQAIARGLRDVAPQAEVLLCPVADGGEGTAATLVSALSGRWIEHTVTGPLGKPVNAGFGLLPKQKLAVVEMAQAAGLDQVPPDQRDPARTTTFGVGELISKALDHGARHILVAIGGSATNDGGTGMAQALGFDFGCGSQPMTGGQLRHIARIDASAADPRLTETLFEVACDVTNPLTGTDGAAAVYGPQKGATAAQIEALDQGLVHLAALRTDSDPNAPGMGAAGGLGFGLVTFCGARLRRGIELVLDAIGFDELVRGADLVITGEGRLDGQSIQGKTCIGIAQAAARQQVPTVALVGSTGPNAQRTLEHGLSAYRAICDTGVPSAEAIGNGPQHLEALARTALRAWQLHGVK